MKIVDLIVNARWILPIAPENKILENYALIIKDHKIIDLLAQEKVSDIYQAETVINKDHHVLMPGLINAHTHLAMSYYKGVGSDLPLNQWLSDYIWPSESATVSAEYVYDATKHALVECLRSGVSCVNDLYFYMNDVASALSEAGMRGRLAHCIFNFETPWAKSVESSFEQAENLINNLKNNQLISVAIGPHSPYAVDDQMMQRVIQLSKIHNLPIHIHLHETKKEVDDYKEKYGVSPIVRFFEKGWLNEKTIGIHLTQLDEKDIDCIVKSKMKVVHCPESNMKLASGISPIQKLLDLGVTVAIGTDGSASNNDIDMISEMKSASFLSKIATGNPESISAKKALEMATINGAKALGFESEIGSLEIGKSADFIAIDFNYPETLPVYDPFAQIVYAASRNQVSDVWVNGKCLMDQYKLLTINNDGLNQNQNKWSLKINQTISSI